LLCPSLVAVIVVEPADIPVTRPVDEMVATPGALLPHVTERPVSTFPAASLVVAFNWTVDPVRRLVVAGATVTDATG
jgi:hypothetical protein